MCALDPQPNCRLHAEQGVMRGIKYQLIALLIIILSAVQAVLAVDSFTGIISSSFNDGGGQSASNDYEVSGTFGQDIADPPVSSSADYTVYAGFWGQQVNLTPQIDGSVVQLGAAGTASVDLCKRRPKSAAVPVEK